MRKHLNKHLPYRSLKQTPIATRMKNIPKRDAILAELVICYVGGLPRLCSGTSLIGIFYILFRHLIVNCIDVFNPPPRLPNIIFVSYPFINLT